MNKRKINIDNYEINNIKKYEEFIEKSKIKLYLQNIGQLKYSQISSIKLCKNNYFENYNYKRLFGYVETYKDIYDIYHEIYSDGYIIDFKLLNANFNSIFPYEEYLINFSKATWVLEITKYKQRNKNSISITISDFDIDFSQLEEKNIKSKVLLRK